MNNQLETKKGGKVLIAYASKFGTTGDVAKTISEVLCADGFNAEAKCIQNIHDLNGYDAVIIGSAIQYDKWMTEATMFVSDNKEALSKVPVAYFFTCLALSVHSEKSRRQGQIYSDRISASFSNLKPISVGRFAGVLDYSKIPFFPRFIVKIVFAFLGVKEGDHRNWPAIKSWAKSIITDLSSQPIQPKGI